MASYLIRQCHFCLTCSMRKKESTGHTIAVACSALSTILPKINGQTFGKDECVSKIIKGIFKLCPSLPTYNPDIIL